MASLPEEISPLPTLNRLGATIPADLDANAVAKAWFAAFSSAITTDNIKDTVDLFTPDSWWRDMLSFTWDFRTFSGVPKITQFLKDRLNVVRPHSFSLRDNATLALQQPYPDLAWIQMMFDFQTKVGIGFGIVRLVPTSLSGDRWKAHVVFTNLEELKDFPEKIGSLRDPAFNHGYCEENRKKEAAFEDRDPTVLIIGSGHSGLGLAARLRALGVPTLVVEKNDRVGDNWRNRYEALCLHDPVWYDHMPYMPFPQNWPVYPPAGKVANWLEFYADAMDLCVWTSSVVTRAWQEEPLLNWNVNVTNKDGTERSLTVKHLVFATGLGGPDFSLPSYAGMDKFKGQLLHSTEYMKPNDHSGKKVVVFGACTSAHDIAVDHYEHGFDVTMYQRSSTYVMSCKNGWGVLFKDLYYEGGPPADLADRLNASFPTYMGIELVQRSTKLIADRDRHLLDGLKKVGFQLNDGINGTGFVFLAFTRASGYYIDTGASQLIADGKIKLKSGSVVKEFTEDGILFEDGEKIKADVVVFATGLGDMKEHIKQICGDLVSEKILALWGLDEEGENKGLFRDSRVKGLWYMLGNFSWSRFHSKHVALQIKAMEESIFGERYSLTTT